MPDQADMIAALGPVSAALNSLGVRHYVGGSVASSFHGVPRTTMDVDVVAELCESDVAPFAKELGADFYVSELAIRDAVRRRSSFNLIHLATSFKVDIFVSQRRPYDDDAFLRASLEQLDPDATFEVAVASAEDVILAKLAWYRLGNEVSERQWQDVTSVLKLLGDAADLKVLQACADELEVADLLTRLLAEVERGND